MTTAVTARPAPASRASRLERALAAYPLVVAYVVLLILTAWQSTKHVTPWNFIDELKWAELSRSIAHTGRPQLRLHDAPFDSLYSYFLSPAWWLSGTDRGYAAAKYLNAAVMTAAIFPAYGLARLFASRWTARAAAVLAVVTPAVSYSSMLIPEALSYFWSTLTVWLVARALLRPTAATVAPAALAIALSPLVRPQLAVLGVAALLATAVVLTTSGRGRAIRRAWSSWDYIGVGALLLGAAICANAYLTHHSFSWQIGTHFSGRMLEYGLWAFGAFAIGIGIVPGVVALAWGLSARVDTREDRVLAGILLGTVGAYGVYAAVKASYISTVFAIRVEERNLIYLAPVVFAVTARWLDRGRTRLVAVAAAAAGVWYLIDTTPYHMEEHFLVDAPGLAILAWLNRTWYWTATDARWLLLAMLALGVVLLVARELLARRRVELGRWRGPAVGFLALVVVAVGAWNLTAEITAADASNAFARDFRGPLPSPPDFIDRRTGGARTLFIGQELGNSNTLWSLEFWNQSIQDVWSTDASVGPPGPGLTPNFARPDGTVDPQIPVRWAVTGGDVDIVGEHVLTKNGLHLIRVRPPLRIAHEVNGVTADGWMSRHSWFAQFSGGPGIATVFLSRSGACGNPPPARLRIRLGPVAVDANAQPALGRVLQTKRVVVRSTPCESKPVRFRATPPFRIDVDAHSTFKPSQYDQRDLSAQVAYSFIPDAKG